MEEAYTGVLNNHRREYNNGKTKHIDKADWYHHEGFFPVIIGKQEWEQVQRLLKRQARPANGNQAKHRYAGLLTCRECGNAFIPMIRCWNGKSRVEYVCRGTKEAGTAAKNVGVEETDPRRPHFVVAGESSSTGTRD